MSYTLVKDPLGYYRCDPIPSDELLAEIYEKCYFTETKPKLIERQEEDITWWNAMFDDRLEIMSEIYRKSSDTMWPLMLDVGCGGGFFLRRAYDRGWYGVGVEPNDVAREYAQKRATTHGGTFYEKSLDAVKENRFWGIHLSEVLEHLPNPLEMLKDCYDRLMVGGSLCVVVPNEKIRGGKWLYPHVFQPPHHINYFDFDSLTALMEMAGFEIYEKSAMYPMETFLMMGLDYTQSESIGRLCHHHRMNFDLGMKAEQRRKFYRELAENKLGREAIIYGVKK
ncbi:MAG: class I SAM-dependent methyltransferase [Syntrophorhabdaceae bacterium]|nr:class I SAM-dependent methyltransferase [Syntrophorhabdaceae bacterium]